MHWVLQDNIWAEEGFARLLTALERLGLSHSIHKVIPFIGEITDTACLDALPKDTKVIVMGSYSLARQAIIRGWVPGAFMGNLDFEIQRQHWGGHMLNFDAFVCRFADVPEQPVPFFLRPVHDTKAFSGVVIDYPYYQDWLEGMKRLPETVDPVNDPLGVNLMTLDTPVMVCRKKEIYTETRCWIVDGRFVTGSLYKRGTIKQFIEVRGSRFDNDLIRFAEDRAGQWSPNRAYVMDVCTSARGFEIVEVGNLNSAGWYDADMNKLVMAIEAMIF